VRFVRRCFVRIAVGGRGLFPMRARRVSLDWLVRSVMRLMLSILIIGTFLSKKLAISRPLKNFRKSIRSPKLSLIPNKHNSISTKRKSNY
jgi:hypothetical protein